MGERINIQEYLDMIKRRKWIIISILLLSLALGGFRMYQNYVSYVPTYTSSVMVKVDTMKVQKEEAAKEREKESKKGSKKNSKDNTDTSSYGQTANNGTGQSTEGYNLYNYSAIAQDESIASRYYTYAADSAAYDKVAQVVSSPACGEGYWMAVYQSENFDIEGLFFKAVLPGIYYVEKGLGGLEIKLSSPFRISK